MRKFENFQNCLAILAEADFKMAETKKWIGHNERAPGRSQVLSFFIFVSAYYQILLQSYELHKELRLPELPDMPGRCKPFESG